VAGGEMTPPELAEFQNENENEYSFVSLSFHPFITSSPHPFITSSPFSTTEWRPTSNTFQAEN
jgi:hypothetical protein